MRPPNGSPAADGADPDPALVARARRGDVHAYAALYVGHAPRVWRFCHRLTGTPADADDLTQDVFLIGWRKLGGFRGGCELTTWLMGIAARRAGRRRRPAGPLPAGAAWAGRGPDAAAEAGEAVERVRAALAALPATARAAVALRDLVGLSYADTAAALGCSVAGVKVRLFRARRRLRGELERRGFGGDIPTAG